MVYLEPKDKCAVGIVFIFGVIMTVMSAVAIAGHATVVNFDKGVAIMDGNQIVSADLHGGTHATATIHTMAYLWNKPNETFPVVIKYPPLPSALNLQKEKKMRSWLASVQGNADAEVYINYQASRADEDIRVVAYTDPIGIVGWIFGLLIGFICLGLIGFVVVKIIKDRPFVSPSGFSL